MAAASTPACDQRRDRSQSQHTAGKMIRMDRARTRRHPAFRKIPQVSHRAGGAAVRAESDPIFPRTGRAHELARGEPQTRIDFAPLLVTESEFFHRAPGTG